MLFLIPWWAASHRFTPLWAISAAQHLIQISLVLCNACSLAHVIKYSAWLRAIYKAHTLHCYQERNMLQISHPRSWWMVLGGWGRRKILSSELRVFLTYLCGFSMTPTFLVTPIKIPMALIDGCSISVNHVTSKRAIASEAMSKFGPPTDDIMVWPWMNLEWYPCC
jgi:hypothetical protein